MICRNLDELSEIKKWLQSPRTVIVDIETTGLNYRKDSIIGVGLSDGFFTAYISCIEFNSRTDYKEIFTKNEMTEVLSLLLNHKLVTHNAAFDLLFIKHYYGVDLTQSLHCDTILLSHLCNENRFSYKLKDLGSSIFGNNVLNEQKEMKESIKARGGSPSEFFMADPDIIAKYCKQDCLLTYRLFKHFSLQLKKDGLYDFFYNQETMPLYKHVTIPMVETGVRLDIALINKALFDIEQDISRIEDEIQIEIAPLLNSIFVPWFLNKNFPPSKSGDFIQEYCSMHGLNLPRTKSGAYSLSAPAISMLSPGHIRSVIEGSDCFTDEEVKNVQLRLMSKLGLKHIFNLNSKHHLKKLFFDTMKEIPVSFTPTGQPKADEEFLLSMMSKYQWCKRLVTYNKLQKIKGTYIQRFLDKAEGDRYYPKWEQHGTVTGRFSGDLQQLPRPVESGEPEVIKYTNLIRNFIIADEGGVLIDADYESLEPHIFSHISKEPALLNIFKNGLDFYSEICIRTEKLSGVSSDKNSAVYLGKINKQKRQTAKAYALGIAYGEEDWKLHIELGISQEEAKKLIRGYWDGFPSLKEVSDANKQLILRKGIVKTEFGRIRRLPDALKIASEHGDGILDSLQLWKDYNEVPAIYEQMKKKRKILKKCLNASINFPTQGAAASIVNRAAIATALAYRSAGIKATIVANIHDELLVSCPEEVSQKASEILQYCMENAVKISLPLKAVPSVGTVYGDIK